eukprot:m.9663 g.9663  ORF g.9663 m.9663 type:complete len:146 (-) comp9474_c0_seq1:91-528(-)
MSSFRSVISTALRGAAARNTAKASSMNRAKQNLFGGRKLLTGVKSGDDKKSPNKSPRTWKPNVFSKNYTSEILSRKISVKVTAYTIRCIDKAGGFDNYILKTKPERLDSDKGMALKAEMQKQLRQQKRAAAAANTQPKQPTATSD